MAIESDLEQREFDFEVIASAIEYLRIHGSKVKSEADHDRWYCRHIFQWHRNQRLAALLKS